MGAAYSNLGQTKVLFEKVKFLRRKPSFLVALEDILNVLTPTHVISDGYTKVFCRLNIFHSLVVVFVSDADAESLS